MATAAEHYRMAEELVAEIERSDGTVDFGDGGEAYVAAAQVHATLALAAATALRGTDGTGMENSHWDDWFTHTNARSFAGNYEDGA